MEQPKKPYVNPVHLIPMISKPGISRDGTLYDNQGMHTDALWCRWWHGRARKMWGYKMISSNYSYPSRGCFGYTSNGVYYFNSGSYGNLETQQFDFSGNSGAFADRTPAGFVSNTDNMWQFDIQYDVNTSNAFILAHAAPNLTNIDSNVQNPIYYGNAYDTSALTAIGSSSISGGIVSLYPYLFGFDSDGGIIWSVAGKPTDMTSAGSGSARVTGRKIICGRSTRGGPGVSPAGLFWALDAVVRATFSGGTAIFNFDRMASKGYSILSSQCVVEYDSIYYWPGQDRFLSFNGVVQELPNNTHMDFFFDNLNFAQRQKVKGIYSPRWGELQWLAPLFGATECNWKLIYNLRERTWYDTPIIRIMGEHNGVFPNPVFFDNNQNSTGKTQLWMHDFGRDEINGATVNAIRSYFRSEMFSSLSPTIQGVSNGEDVSLKLKKIIPDFKDQVGDLIITLEGQKYPQSSIDVTKTITCPVDQDKLDPEFQSKNFVIQVESNTLGGDYLVGMPMMGIQKGVYRP